MKNMQKTDSGLYTAKTTGQQETTVAEHKVSVIDPVDSPVLNWNATMINSCIVDVTCSGHVLILSTSYQTNNCSQVQVTSFEMQTLTLHCIENIVVCNYSNPVSWKNDSIDINPICTPHENTSTQNPKENNGTFPLHWLLIIAIAPLLVFAAVSAICCSYKKRKKGAQEEEDHTIYAQVQPKNKVQRPLEMLEKSTHPQTVYGFTEDHKQTPNTSQNLPCPEVVTMAVHHLLVFLLFLPTFKTGFSDENSVFVQTGDSIQLGIQTQEIPQEFDDLSWRNEKSENIVKYFHKSKEVRPHTSYKDRVDFNNKTLSLTLKNMQKTDSGLYTARTSGETEKIFVTYRVSVIDAVTAPVLTVNSIWSSSDSCTVNFTCRAHDLMIHSSYQNNSCSPEEVKSHINTLILYCSEESIICNHSNPISSKKERIEIKKLCVYNEASMCNAEIAVSVQTGSSIQLDIQTDKLPEFQTLVWMIDESENIVISMNKETKILKDNVVFNQTTFSLTLKNLQKTDSGLYNAKIIVPYEKDVAKYRVSVIDPVDSPVLNWNITMISVNSCIVNITCSSPDHTVSNSYHSNCSQEEVTSTEMQPLTVYCKEDVVICNYSNTVSWRNDTVQIKQLCTTHESK
ncbi:CD48 antigen [Anabarilius grahami]|uniref:CD48 antigen n=1 Tax=Anabarilius grahami TaxID=495550 RepID=A0A3N0XSG7_ANAGA|nr:CD48 antigen [Anabarilius grahami]